MKKLIAMVVVLTLFISLSMASPVTAQTVWHVDDDGIQYPNPDFTTIQAAIDDASTVPGDTIIVHYGIYNENVFIHKSDLTIQAAQGEDRPVVNGGTGSAFVINANGVTVKGFNATCTNLNVIHLNLVEYVMIHDNEVSGATEAAIMVYGSYNTIKGNHVHHSHSGIGLQGDYNQVIGNDVSHITGLPSGGIQINGDNNQVIGNELSDCSYDGIQLYLGNNNEIQDNNIYGTTPTAECGIFVNGSDNTLIKGNTIKHWKTQGINLYVAANGNTVRENTISEIENTTSEMKADGIVACNSDGNVIKENKISKSDRGITLHEYSFSNEVFENEVSKCDQYGIQVFDWAESNRIRENRIYNSGDYDLYWDLSALNSWEENKYKISSPGTLPSLP